MKKEIELRINPSPNMSFLLSLSEKNNLNEKALNIATYKPSNIQRINRKFIALTPEINHYFVSHFW